MGNPQVWKESCDKRRGSSSCSNGGEGVGLLSCRAGSTAWVRKHTVGGRMGTRHSDAEGEACTDL